MNRAVLVTKIASQVKLSKAIVNTIIGNVMTELTQSLKKGERVRLTDFGTFSVSKRAARKGVNPQTKKTISIAAKKVVKFRPGKALKDSVAKSR